MLNFHETATTIEAPLCAQTVTRHEPIGVVGVISPWNLPLYLLTWKVAPALAMGNCVVAKPSELTSLTAFRLAQLVKQAGFPDGVFNFVFGYGHAAGQALVEHAAVPAVSFTGGTMTGRRIAAAAAPFGKKLSLELGGKNPAIVFADCDLDAAVATSVRAAFSNQGEICLCCSRILVQRPIYEEFLARLAHQAAALKVGDPLDPDTQMGALVSAAHRAKVASYIDTAKQEGARIVCGGDTAFRVAGLEEGFFLPPTIVADADPASRLMQEEIFGPVVGVVPFETEEEAVALANGVEYGLAASVWTRDGARGQRVAQQIKSGVVWVNCWMVRDLASPFGGVKASGYGREGGRHSLEFFSDIKTITTPH